jgi:hypothetical protein
MKPIKIELIYPQSENLMSIFVRRLNQADINNYLVNLSNTIYIIDSYQYKFTSLFMSEDECFINIVVNIQLSKFEIPLLPTDFVVEIDNSINCLSLNNL